MIKWKKKDGCVYFFKHTGLEPVKIGYCLTNDPHKRFNQFRTYAPFGGDLIGFEKSSMAFELEQGIHDKYKEKRLKGEWFLLTDEEIKTELENIRNVEIKLF